MKIKVHPVNADAINVALASVNGRARAFTIDSMVTVMSVAKDAENDLQAAGVTKRNRVGTIVRYRPAGPSARAYDAGAISTEITLVRGSQDWYLTNVERVTVWPRQKDARTTLVSKAARDDIVRGAMKGFSVVMEEVA